MVVTTTRRRGIIKNGGGWGWECLGQNSFLRHIFAKYSFLLSYYVFFSIPVPVPGYSQEWKPLIPFPELWEWIFSFPSHSRICHFTDGNQNRNWSTVRDTRLPIFSATSTFFTTIYIDEVKWAKEFNREWLKGQGVLLSSVANIYAAKV